MDESIKAVRREKWRKVVMSQKASGLTITEWCEQNGMRTRQFHYWQKVLRDNDLLEMKTSDNASEISVPACTESKNDSLQVFAEIPVSHLSGQDSGINSSTLYGQDSGIMIRYQDLQIRITDTFNEGALSRVLQVIRNA